MGVPNFAPRFDDELVRPFWDGLKEGDLRLPACSECGAWQWYPRDVISCHPQARLKWTSVSKTGTIFSFTTIRRNFLPTSNDQTVPYTCALVEIDEVYGPRIAAILIHAPDKKPEIGMRVALAPIKLPTHDLPAFELVS